MKMLYDVIVSACFISDSSIQEVFHIISESKEVGPSICVHTGVPWGLKNLERDKDEVAQDIIAQLKTILPDLPEPVEVKGHKWRYSQVRLFETAKTL